MPRALRGRFEPLDHFVLSHLSTSGLSLPLGSPHTAKRFIGLAIIVGRKINYRRQAESAQLTHHTSLVRRTYETDIAVVSTLLLGVWLLWLALAWLVDALTLPVG